MSSVEELDYLGGKKLLHNLTDLLLMLQSHLSDERGVNSWWALEDSVVGRVAVSVPDCDTAGKDTLCGASVEGVKDWFTSQVLCVLAPKCQPLHLLSV